MKRIAIVLTAVLLVLMSGTVIYAQETTKSRAVTYKTVGDKKLKIHLHFPPDWKTRDSRPAIIFFFGGGWTGGTTGQFEFQADYLAGRGMVAARADYRVKSRDGVTPDKCVEDARSAVRWMRKNSRRLGIDPGKLIASGGSAGGHLAACMMIADSVEAKGDDLSISTIPQAIVLFNPVLSFENERMLTRLGDNKHLARKISPTSHLNKRSPPALILFGTNDRLKAFGDDYWKKAEEIGVRADKYLAEGQGHGFFNRSPWRERTLIAADKFLASLGYLRGEPTVEVPKAAASPPRKRSADRPDRQNLAKRLQRNRAGSALKGEIVTLPDKISSQAESLDSSFVMYIQTKVIDGKKAPLIIFLHGGGGTRRKIEDFLWNNQAKAVNQKDYPFNVLIPRSKGQWKPKDLDLLLEHVVKEYNIDTKRIYLTGHSMGGAGTWRWASTRPKTFAAIAPLAGGGRNREEGIVDLPLEGLK
ncbi:MAG: alpha/beta hydrolase fold domain-containing protein, partial [Planctomycetes bacterium]|nr:alpha/beta hydrolase fold domain-containing protein [Planctomycetota bacterium]